MNYPALTIVGNLTAPPELRFTSGGHAVANFTVAVTPRTFNKQSNQWVDDETLWVRCSVWRETAENVAESLDKGSRVLVHGHLKARSFEDKQGNQRTNWEMEVEEVGPSLRFATAQATRAPRQGNQPQGYAQQPQAQPQPQQGGWGAPATPPAGDPWAGQQGQSAAPF